MLRQRTDRHVQTAIVRLTCPKVWNILFGKQLSYVRNPLLTGPAGWFLVMNGYFKYQSNHLTRKKAIEVLWWSCLPVVKHEQTLAPDHYM
jgi:hypothetical protein